MTPLHNHKKSGKRIPQREMRDNQFLFLFHRLESYWLLFKNLLDFPIIKIQEARKVARTLIADDDKQFPWLKRLEPFRKPDLFTSAAIFELSDFFPAPTAVHRDVLHLVFKVLSLTERLARQPVATSSLIPL